MSGLVGEAASYLLKDSRDFIVVGLTGRTGSGCSTSARLLSSHALHLPDPGDSHYTGNERRKYRIIKRYIDKNWKPFYWLQVKTVIARFILELSFDEFIVFLSSTLDLDSDHCREMLGEFELFYNEAHQDLSEYLRISDEDYDAVEEKKEKAYRLYFEVLPVYCDRMKSALDVFDVGAYTKLMQASGDNVRSSGKADCSNFVPGKFFSVARVINKIDKIC